MRESNKRRIETKDMIIMALFAALTAVGAFIKIPLPVVPFTLQVVFCALSGIILGSRLGFGAQLLYVLVGLAGVPIFTKGGGIGYVFQPTFGYLIGFVLAGYVIGKIIEIRKKVDSITIFIASLGGLAVIYLVGVPYLYFALRTFSGVMITWEKAVAIGFTASILGDIFSCLIIALVSPTILKALKREKLSYHTFKY